MLKKNEIEYFYRGRWALTYLLENIGITKGDNVALQSYTCTAVPQSISSIGAIPTFIDIDKNLNMSVSDLKKKLSGSVPIKAVIIQHTFGIVCTDEISFLCKKNGIPIIEDCCHMPFNRSTFNSKSIDSIGQFFSFEWGKPIPAGIGGAAVFSEQFKDSCFNNSNRDNPPILKSLKIEIQFMVFKYFYKPSTYFFLKRLFSLITKLGFAEGNHADLDELLLKSKESRWSIPPLVKKRVISNPLHLNVNIQKHKSDLKEKIIYLNAIFGDNFLNGIIKEDDQVIRYPIYVDDKKNILKLAAELKHEIGDWYSSPVDPLSKKELISLGWDLSSCPLSHKMSSHVITLPLNEKSTLASIKKTSIWLRSHFDSK